MPEFITETMFIKTEYVLAVFLNEPKDDLFGSAEVWLSALTEPIRTSYAHGKALLGIMAEVSKNGR